LRALGESVQTLVWSMSVLAVLILVAGIFMAQVLGSFVRDESKDLESRRWVFNYYGSPARSTYTMFEATFSGGWLGRARPLIDDVSSFFAVFWVLYQVMIAFAVTRVVAALFLKQTLQVASSDEDMMVMEKLKQKEQFVEKLRRFFQEADTSGDGLLSPDEFEEMLRNPAVISMLQVLELEMYEVTALYNLLDDGEGEVSFEEFLSGAMRLKGNARAIDAITIAHEQHKIKAKISDLSEGVEKLFVALRVADAWKSRHATSPSTASKQLLVAAGHVVRKSPTNGQVVNPAENAVPTAAM